MEKNNWCCEITGIPFDLTVPRGATTISIDKIDPAKGYTNDNVRLICWWLNCALGTWGLEKLKEYIKEIPTGTSKIQDKFCGKHL